MEIVLSILAWLSPILVSVLTLVLTALVKKWLDKLGVERTLKTDELVTNLVTMSIASVEKVALNKLKETQSTTAGTDKKAQAVNMVLGQLEAAGIKDVAKKVVEDRIEALLHINAPKV